MTIILFIFVLSDFMLKDYINTKLKKTKTDFLSTNGKWFEMNRYDKKIKLTPKIQNNLKFICY